MADQPPSDNDEERALSPDESDQTILAPEVAGAITTLKLEIARLEGEGAAGLRGLRILLDEVGAAIFDYGERVIAVQQEEGEAPSRTMILFAGRNLEAMVRYLIDADLLSSGVRFILREADESMVVAHAMAAVELLRVGSTDHLRAQGERAYKECQIIAHERGFGARVDKLIDLASEDKGSGTSGDGS